MNKRNLSTAAALLLLSAAPSVTAAEITFADLLCANDNILVFSDETQSYMTLKELIERKMVQPEKIRFFSTRPEEISFRTEPILDYSAIGQEVLAADSDLTEVMPGPRPAPQGIQIPGWTDLPLSVVPVPEPGCGLLALLGSALALFRRKAQKHR